MDPASRYEILDTIATGDFATVYRGRDLELGREVAIKQIHPQFLADPQQLARYWQEAQLLASLRHPNILTIYDIVRPRGWLILELMQTNLRDHVAGQPIDLDLLRAVMAGSLGALDFLHGNGVIHGDVKPNNILLDARGRIVLGDFGLARRASSEEGSLLKGTTKYMAPELVAPELGAVGPASDLYSLGFSAYDLMCGEQFESLFPGLSTFGRDRQIAWMMWHAAPDRQLPPIGRVLEGVPKDLAGVVERLIVKDPARRYHSAEEVLQDLRHDPAAVAVPPVADTVLADAEAAAKKRRRLRLVAILAMAFSLMLSIAMLLPEKKRPLPPPEPEPTRGVIHQVYPDERRLALETDDGVDPIKFSRHDRFLLNDKPVLLRELKTNDRIVVEELRDTTGRRIQEIHAYRPIVNKGRVDEVNSELGQLTLVITEGEDEGERQQVTVQPDLKILLNDEPAFRGQPVQLKDLQPNDRVIVHHEEHQTERVATVVKAYRVVQSQGVLRDIDPSTGTIELETGPADNTEMRRWPTASRVEITLNSLQFVDGRLLKLSDLEPGDNATVAHDTEVVRIDADRMLHETAVVTSISYEGSTSIQAVRDDSGETVTYLVPPSCKITLFGESVKLSELRAADRIAVAHASFDAPAPEAMTIAAERPPDPRRWAVLVGIAEYDDPALKPLPHAVADAELLRNALVRRYRVPQQQTLLLTDGRLLRLREELPKWLRRLGADDRLVVYYGGHAVRDSGGTVYLATERLDLKRMKETGLTLAWLVDEMENCAAGDKMLLFDGAHADSKLPPERQASSAEMLESLAEVPGRSPLTASHAIAACQAGQRGTVLDTSDHGLFAACLARAYSGEADANRDVKLEPTELLSYLAETMPAAAKQAGAAQTAKLYLPEQGRLTPEAKEAIRSLASLGALREPDLVDAAHRFQAARQLAGSQPEPGLLYALLLVKARQRDQAVAQLQELQLTQPGLLLPPQALAWIRFEQRSYKPGIDDLATAVQAVPNPAGPNGEFPLAGQKALYFSGQLREFAAEGPSEAWRPPADALAQLDAAAAARGERAVAWYERGRARARQTLEKYDREITDPNTPPAAVARKKVERRQLNRYAVFPYGASDVLSGLDR